jgi:prepilin-type N-terminal cleavage/methylation domain-containing protein
MRGKLDQRGLGLIEIVLVLVVLAVAGALLYRYVGSTARTVEKLQEERTLAHARLAADRATLWSMRSVLQTYHAQHGQWPADKPAVLGLLHSPPSFQCSGNDVEYDPAGGTLRLLIDDAARC